MLQTSNIAYDESSLLSDTASNSPDSQHSTVHPGNGVPATMVLTIEKFNQAQWPFVKLRMNAIYLNICSGFAAGRGDSYMDKDKRSPLECPEYAICFDRRGLLFALASGKDPTAAVLPAKARLARTACPAARGTSSSTRW